MKSASSVDGLLPIDLVRWEDHHSSDGVAQCVERFEFGFRELADDPAALVAERWDDGVAREKELAEFGSVIEVFVPLVGVQIELITTWQRSGGESVLPNLRGGTP